MSLVSIQQSSVVDKVTIDGTQVKITIFKSFLFGVFLLATGSAHADLTCAQYNGKGYCNYKGKISQIYVNRYGQLILYFPESFDLSHPSSVGLAGITVNNAMTVNMSKYPEFGKQMLTLGLSAKMSNATVILQVGDWHGDGSYKFAGYLQPDRIWVE